MSLNLNMKRFIILYAVLVTLSVIFMDKILAFDLMLYSNLTALQTPWLNSMFTSITFMGSLIFWVLIASMLWISKDKKLSTYLFLGLVIDTIVILFLKFGIGRPRPEITVFSEIGPSFPSAHTSRAFLGASIIKHYREILIVIAILVAFSRLYLGVHYFSDVVFGAMNGILISIVVLQLPEKKLEKYINKIMKIF